jgi:hypothetical protein
MTQSSKAEWSEQPRVVRVTPSQVRAAKILLELDREAGRRSRRSTVAIAGAGTKAVLVKPTDSVDGAEPHPRTATDRPRLA